MNIAHEGMIFTDKFNIPNVFTYKVLKPVHLVLNLTRRDYALDNSDWKEIWCVNSRA